ncbi:MAG: tripartite tricarboxylate transporter substrate binding protein [Rhodomicrobium sp.]|nr:tripartite tricarboxylate transporter substrate binding protein [Rhodomicrobium sp.]
MIHPIRLGAIVGAALLACAGLAQVPASAQDKFPSRPIELIVPFGPGGGADQLARLTGKLLEPMVGQGIPVVNVPGSTGATGMAKLTAAPADGYSMAVYIADTHALLTGDTPRWTIEDITPLAVMIQAPSFIFVSKDSPYKTWADFEKAAKAEPGKLKVAVVGFGSVDDFTLKHLETKGGVKVVQVPFSKPTERYTSILGGHADALYEQAGDVGQFLASGEMRPILMFGDKRLDAFKDVPASGELGYTVSLPQFRSISVRSGTPAEHVKYLSDALAKVAASDEFKDFLVKNYADPNSFLPADQAGEFLKKQLEDMQKAKAGS